MRLSRPGFRHVACDLIKEDVVKKFVIKIVAFHMTYVNLTVWFGLGQIITTVWTAALCRADLSRQLAPLSDLNGSLCLQLHTLHTSHLLNTNWSLLLKHPHMCKASGSTWWFQGVDGGLTTVIFKPRVILEEVSYWFTSWLVLADQQKPMIQTVQPYTQ